MACRSWKDRLLEAEERGGVQVGRCVEINQGTGHQQTLKMSPKMKRYTIPPTNKYILKKMKITSEYLIDEVNNRIPHRGS